MRPWVTVIAGSAVRILTGDRLRIDSPAGWRDAGQCRWRKLWIYDAALRAGPMDASV